MASTLVLTIFMVVVVVMVMDIAAATLGIVTDMTMKAITKLFTQVLVVALVVLTVFVIYYCEWRCVYMMWPHSALYTLNN